MSTQKPPKPDWETLNTRQQDYLVAIYYADQEVEKIERSSWSRGGRPRPAEEWRWMLYINLGGHDLPVKKHLTLTQQISEGTGSTLEALERRGLIQVRYDINTYRGQPIFSRDPIPAIKITTAGRTMVRKALAIPKNAKVVGTLQEWHWRALAKAYKAGDQGVPKEGIGYGRIGWNTWLRLRNYKIQGEEYPLVADAARITPWGRAFYERSYTRYHELYPEVTTIEPLEHYHPEEPFIEIIYDTRRCRACAGDHLAKITRTYQQNRQGKWSFNDEIQHLPGIVTHKDRRKVEQCTCREEDIQETYAPFLGLIDQCIEQGCSVAFPRHYWFDYIDSLVSETGFYERGPRWHNPQRVKEKLQQLLDDTQLEAEQNITRGMIQYLWNPKVGRGTIYPIYLRIGLLHSSPVALTCRKTTLERNT